MDYIKGKIVGKGDKWYRIIVFGKGNHNQNFLLIDKYSKDLQTGDTFNLWVQTSCKKHGNKYTYYHIPKKCSKSITIGFGVDTMIVQPITGNVFVKGNMVLRITSVKIRTEGWSYGYTSEDWWECTCIDITNTADGKKALEEIIEV